MWRLNSLFVQHYLINTSSGCSDLVQIARQQCMQQEGRALAQLGRFHHSCVACEWDEITE